MSERSVELDFSLERANGTSESVCIPVSRLVNCGWTGRNTRDVQQHIDELEAEGVTAPEEFPVLYPKPYHLITNRSDIEVLASSTERDEVPQAAGRSPATSGEAEFVLFPQTDEVYVGVGSDHTDRELERESIVLSKAVCPNVVGDELWVLSDVIDHWDDIELRSWTGRGDEREPYQKATLGAILPPDELLQLVDDAATTAVERTAIFSGSVGTETAELVYADVFSVELADPILDRTLTAEYAIRELDWLV